MKNQLDTLLASARLRNQRRLARKFRESFPPKDRRPTILAAGRAHRALRKHCTRTDAEYRRYIASPLTASLPALNTMAAELRKLTDDVRQLAPKCKGSIAGNAMDLQMREDANLAMRLVRRIAALPRHQQESAAPPPALPELAPLHEPPKPQEVHFDFGPLAHEFVGPLLPEKQHSDYWWDQQLKRLDGSLGEWKAQRKKGRAAYEKTKRGQRVRKKARDTYMQSDKGKAARAKYNASDKAKAARARYAQSEKGKAARQRAAALYLQRHKTPAQHDE